MQANGTGTTGSGVQEFQLEYASMLSDLTFNSKPMINSLTMVAEENKGLAEVIVNLVERRIAEVSIPAHSRAPFVILISPRVVFVPDASFLSPPSCLYLPALPCVLPVCGPPSIAVPNRCPYKPY